MDTCDVAIIGAGPYGLAAAAHLNQIPGLDVRLLGEPMTFWQRHMPEAMFLRSPWVASSIADPGRRFSLDAYRHEHGLDGLDYPVPVREFIRYGRWVHERLAPCTHRCQVTSVELTRDRYRLTLDTGGTLTSRRVVVACGIQLFAYRPAIFRDFPAALVTHTSEPTDVGRFAGKQVVVIGAGQSALEAAGFMRAAGADVEVLIRNPAVHWLGKKRQWLHAKGIRWMFYGRGDIGPAGVSLFVQHPNLFRRLPRGIQDWWGPRAVRPAVFDTLMAATDVRIRGGCEPVRARVDGDRLRVRFDDGRERVVDHVVLGTGYRVDIARYPFLPAALVERVARVNGYPRVDAGFETSSPGLHIVGAPAAWSFGPLMRFVAGTEFAGPALLRRVRRAARRASVATSGANLADPLTPETDTLSG